MAEGVAIAEAGEGTHALLPETITLRTRTGYCADCGTWDVHGRFCAACGYDFMPESESPAPL